jgi:acetylserotonin O-methyltransferase
MTTPDPSSVIDLIDAFRRSKAMFTAVRLGIFDHLERGPAGLADLARTLPANADALERLLDANAGLGLLQKLEDGRYANTAAASTYLVRSSPNAMTGYILYSDEVLFRMWANLADAVREGTHRWPQTFGSEGPIFDHFFRDDESKSTFLQGMHGFGLLSSPAVAAAFDLGAFTRLVDLGGATGHLAAAICERNPGMRAAIFDLAPVVEFAREYVRRSAAPDRLELIAGDFFTDPLPPADLYALGRILHDWSEPKIRILLRKIHQALPPGGGLLIAEKLLAPDKSGPPAAHLQSLNMLICTEGKERTLAEYESLLRAAGFSEVRGRVTGAPLDAALAIKGNG